MNLKRAFQCVCLTAPGVLSLVLLHAQTLLTADQRTAIQHFREHQAEVMKGPQSALGMVSLESLPEGDTTVGAAPDNKLRLEHTAAHLATLHRDGETLALTLPAGSDLTADGRRAVPGLVSFDADGTSARYESGSVNFVLRHKFGFFLVGRDTQAPALLAFHGLHWYPADGRYRIIARWLPYPVPRTLPIANILGQVNQETSYGVAEFSLGGRTFRLEPTVHAGATPLFFVFRDTTSRSTTYQGGRFLDAAMPSHGLSALGQVVLDFNMARNPLCAFSAHTSCPLPPRQNVADVAIPAGEKRYQE